MKRLRKPEQRHRHYQEGQSLVEMSFILPLLLIVLFGIIDLGYYVYSFATVYQAARRGSDMAAFYPPFPSMLRNGHYDMSDKCVSAVVEGTKKGAGLVDLSDIATNRDHFSITYFPAPDADPDYTDKDPREPGKTVQVAITHTIEPLTPLFGLVPVFGNQGRLTVYAKSMRTIQGRGESMPSSGNGGNRVICSGTNDW